MRCGNCGRARDGHRGACECVPAWVWRDPEVMTAVRERDAQRVIQFLRRRVKDLSQEALAGMCGVAQSTINRAEAGKGLTDRRRAHEALQGLGALRSPDVPRSSQPPEPPVAPTPSNSSLFSPQVKSLLSNHDLAIELHLGRGRRISHTTVDRLMKRVHALRLADDVIAGGDLIAPALRELSTATALLETSSHTDKVGQSLRVAVGELSQITGWIASDAGQHERAEHVYRLGLTAARQAGDTTLAAQIAGSLAYQLTNTGQETRGVELAEAAIAEAGAHAPARARALYWDRFAWAHAKRGDNRAASQALARASESLSHHDPGREEEPGWLYWVDEEELQIMEARVYTELHRPLRAVPLLEEVLSRYDTTHGRELALYLSWLAVAYVDANEPEEAARVAETMMAHSHGLGSDRTTEREWVVRRALERFRELPEIRQVLEAH